MNGHEVSTAARAIQKEITKKDGEQAAETNGHYEICAVNYKDHVKITIDKAMMNSELGFGRRVLGVLEDLGISFGD